MKRSPVFAAAVAVILLFWPTAETFGESKAEADKRGAEESVKPAKLTVASWGGAYTESQKRAYFTPFRDETGITIEIVSHNGAFDALAADDDSSRPKWDIVDLDPATLERSCRDGVLEKLDPSALAAASDGTSASDDFLPGTIHECGVPSVAWSSAIVFDKRAFKKNAPKTAKDFFDVKRFPGKRALPRGLKYTLELALMADGVTPGDVYDTLAQDGGIERALTRLDAIRDQIVWWERGHEPLKALAKQEAAMALAFNGRIFSAIVAENKPFGIIWDAQVFDLDLWAVPAGSRHKKSAIEFIAFATRPDRLAQQARWFPYGPVRKSALKLIGKHPEVDVDMAAYIPTSAQNFRRALRIDAAWWQRHQAKVREKFRVWLIGDGGSAESGADAESENAVQ